MKIQKFEDIIAWKTARTLSGNIYNLFKFNKDYSFKDQIQRATTSISNNIAEGFERNPDKEFRQFLYIAKGSSAEVRSMLYIALDLKYISEKEFEECYGLVSEIPRLLSAFIKTL